MSILLVDNSYNAFYRINATQSWFKFSHPEIEIDENYIWEDNQEFLDKLEKMYFSSLKTIIKKHNILKENIYFCMDCPRSEIWRLELYSDYKGTRCNNKNLKGIFNYIYDNIIPKLIETNEIKTMSYPNLEADDIIAIFKKNIREKHEDKEIIIITNDHDYLQLIDDNTYIYNLQKKLLNEKSLGNAKQDLMVKILMGDTSDNISRVFPKCGIKTALKYSTDSELLEKKLNEDDSYKQKYILNTKLIDFEEIPQIKREGVLNKYNLFFE